MHLTKLREKEIKELSKMATKAGVDNAAGMKKHEIIFALLKKEAVEEAHNEVKASINYAERIQKALLSADEHWDNISKEHFILFKPRDVVSGDFYWAYSKDDVVIWAAADCTGHGVPGAFVTMLVKAIERQIIAKIHNEKTISPAKILSTFNRNINKVKKCPKT